MADGSRAARGLGWDTETLTGVLVATVRDPAIGPPAPDSGTASNGQGHIGVGGQPAPFSRQHGVPQGDTSTQAKIPARGGKLPGTYQGRRGPRPLRGAVNGPGAIACCPSSSLRGGRRP